MSTFTNQVIANFALSQSFAALSEGIAVVVAIVLLVLLIEKVMLDAYEGKSDENKTYGFTLIIFPLIFVMVAVTFMRMAQILHL